jgi:hypothetical protein
MLYRHTRSGEDDCAIWMVVCSLWEERGARSGSVRNVNLLWKIKIKLHKHSRKQIKIKCTKCFMNTSSDKHVCRYACMCVCMYVCMYICMYFFSCPCPLLPWKIQSAYLLELQAQHLCQSVRNIQLCSSKSRKINNFKTWTENTDWMHIIEGTCSYTMKFQCDSSLIIYPIRMVPQHI